jgi:hypothetical protein
MDQTDVAFGVALPVSACTAVMLIKWAGWPWYVGLPIGLVGGFILTAAAVLLLIELLARSFGYSHGESDSDSDA